MHAFPDLHVGHARGVLDGKTSQGCGVVPWRLWGMRRKAGVDLHPQSSVVCRQQKDRKRGREGCDQVPHCYQTDKWTSASDSSVRSRTSSSHGSLVRGLGTALAQFGLDGSAQCRDAIALEVDCTVSDGAGEGSGSPRSPRLCALWLVSQYDSNDDLH